MWGYRVNCIYHVPVDRETGMYAFVTLNEKDTQVTRCLQEQPAFWLLL